MSITRRTMLAGLLALPATAAFYYRHELALILQDPAHLALRKRLEARWRALDLTRQALEGRVEPAAWSVGLFVGRTVVADLVRGLHGARLDYVPSDGFLSGTVVTLEHAELRPQLGGYEAEIVLTAARGDLRLEARGTAMFLFDGTEQTSADEADGIVWARFSLLPIELAPVTLGPFELDRRIFWSRLLADLALALVKPDLFVVKLPLQDRFTLPLKVAEKRRERVNGDGAEIAYTAKLPGGTLDLRAAYVAPIATTDGIWLLAKLVDESTPTLTSAQPPAGEVLAETVAALERELTPRLVPFARSSDAIALHVGTDLFAAMASAVGAMSGEQRTLTLKSFDKSGRLANVDWHNRLLGKGGAFAELAYDDGAEGTIWFGAPQLAWREQGFTATLPVALDASAKLKVHVDPLIGGGVGTIVKLVGKSRAELTLEAEPCLLANELVSAAVVTAKIACQTVRLDLVTDGKLSTDWGWTKVPSVGARLGLPVGRQPLPPLVLMDSRPHFVPMPKIDAPSGPDGTIWRFTPAIAAMTLAIAPRAMAQSAAGLELEAQLRVEHFAVSVADTAALDSARSQVRAEAESTVQALNGLLMAAHQPTNCGAASEFAVLLGNLEFGSENEIVKFVKNAWNDITKGPGPNNELVRALDAAGETFHKAGRAVEEVVQEVVKMPDNVVKEIGRAPKNLKKILRKIRIKW